MQPEARKNGNRLLQAFLALVIVGGGGFGAVKLIKSRKQAQRQPPVSQGVLVEALTAAPGAQRARVVAQGNVVPAQQVQLQPQVQGVVEAVHPQLVIGGRLPAGAELLRIEDADYRLAVEQQQANLARVEFELEVEQGRKSVAEREWKLLQRRGGSKSSGKLARREPHIRAAKAAVRGAKSALRRARLDVARTRIEAPFNAIVEAESVEVGQVARPGAPVATLVGTDAFWVQVSVPVDELGWLQMPDAAGEGGAKAEVVYRYEGREVRRPARVVRLLGRLDPVGRMAQLMVQVDDPLNLAPSEAADGAAERAPLLLGAYVTVEIEGRTLDDVYEVPRLAVRPGDRIWKVTDERTLEITPVRVVRRRADTVLIDEGVAAGDRIVTSRLTAPVPGMRLRLPGDKKPEAPKARAQKMKPGEKTL